ncbi:MAG: TonB family protein [Nibricoccus sp.]
MKKYLSVAVVGLVFVHLVSWLHGQAPAAAEVLAESDPMVKAWVPPVYPADLKKEKVTGQVQLELIVDEKGAVSAVKAVKSSDPRFEAAAIESVRQWTIDPGVSEGVRTAMGVKLTLRFQLPEPKHGLVPPMESWPKPLPKTDAKSEDQPRPEYPSEMMARKIPGRAVVAFVVKPDGSVSNLELGGTSHPAFVRPVLQAAASLKFSPAMQGDLPVSARIVSPMEFTPDVMFIGEKTTTHLEINGLSVRLSGEQTQSDLCTTPPEIWSIPDAIYPRGAALAGIEGEAVVEFEIDERGNPENVRVASSSAPEFGQVLVDALTAGGTFKPAKKDGRGVNVPMQWKHVFKLPAAEPVDGETSEDRLIRFLRSGQTIASAKGLDAKLRPLWRVAAPYPKELREEGTKGTAEVEIIIDRDGRVRLPYVVNATNEKFGRAAVVAASQWVFDVPMRGGQPTDVRVRVPFQFAP